MTETHADSLAGALLDARRGKGLTQAELARAAGLTEVMVRDAEQGVALPGEAARALCLALALDPAPHVPGLVAAKPVPLDAGHAKVVGYLEDLAAREGATLALPDVAALTARSGMTDAGRAAVDAGAKRLSVSEWLMSGGFACMLVTAVGGSSMIMARGDHLTMVAVLVGLGCSVAAAIAGAVTSVSRMGDGNPSRVRKREVDAWYARRQALARTGYVLARDAVTVLSVEGGEVRRRELLASSFTSVEVAAEDEGHVTVRVDGLLGEVTMPWLPRTRDLLDAVASWSPRGGRPYLEGPQ